MVGESLHEGGTELSFEKVWTMFQETGRRIQETERVLQEITLQMKETDRQMKETDRQMKETDRKIGNLGSRIGDIVEHMVAPNILQKFEKLGYVFGKVAPRVQYSDLQGRHIAEVDLLLESGDAALAVEVKTNLTSNDVRDHVKWMETLRRYADERGDRRKLLGAVAGAVASGEVKAFALKNGFFVLEQSGDTIQIAVPEDFKPREW
jgi:septal ring factor EnvC (AmiA/AmiB activator)